MAARGDAPQRGGLETILLAGVGALAVATERVDELAREVAERLGVDPDEVRTALTDALGSGRREAERLGESTTSATSRLAAELGISTREAVSELELRVAQLEHRLKLLERS